MIDMIKTHLYPFTRQKTAPARRACFLVGFGTSIVSLFAAVALAQPKIDPSAKQSAGPLSPREELASFRTLKGFRVELVASEPEVIDPVAMCFDARADLRLRDDRLS